MGRHSDAQRELAIAFKEVFGREPTLNERLFAGAVALGESGYSRAYYTNKKTGERKVLNNWGAIQCGQKPPCGPGCFETSDYNVLPDGSHQWFNWCYRDDATRELAAITFIETLYKKRPKLLAAANSFPSDAKDQLLGLKGNDDVDDPAPLYDGHGTTVSLSNPYYLHIAWFSHVMRDSKYFGLELKKHIGAQIRYHNTIAAETGERIDGGIGNMPNPKETPEDYSSLSREDWALRLLLALQADAAVAKYASFGPNAKTVIAQYQATKGLAIDGIMGPKTLSKLLSDT